MSNKEILDVVYINAETMGRGDDELGAVIMGAYVETLTNFVGSISHILLVNGGVKLVCAGSDVLDNLQQLAEAGVEILSCGTCLKHFNITDELQAGSVSNMFTILDAMSNSRKVLQP